MSTGEKHKSAGHRRRPKTPDVRLSTVIDVHAKFFFYTRCFLQVIIMTSNYLAESTFVPPNLSPQVSSPSTGKWGKRKL